MPVVHPAPHIGHQEHHEDHVVPVSVYIIIFTALLVLTAVTVWVAGMDLGILNNVVALGIAFVKASLVVLFFMHVKYNSRLIGLTVVGTLAFLVILFAHTLSDYMTRGWL